MSVAVRSRNAVNGDPIVMLRKPKSREVRKWSDLIARRRQIHLQICSIICTVAAKNLATPVEMRVSPPSHTRTWAYLISFESYSRLE